MIRLAICDDNDTSNQRISKFVEQCFSENNIRYKQSIFNSSKAFWHEIDEDGFFDIVLMDIRMPEMDGMNLSKEIRKKLPNVILIFISAYEKYMVDVFELNAFRFIPKSQINKRLPVALLDAVKKINQEMNRYYVIENKQSIEKIPLKAIVKIWREGKNSMILQTDGTISRVRKTLITVFKELPNEDFAWINKGMICNLAHVISINGERVLLKGNIEVPIIRGNILELKGRIRNYWIEREGL